MADGFNQLDQQLMDGEYGEGLPAAYPPDPYIDERPVQVQHANIWARLAIITGLASVLAGLALLAHAVAPTRLGVIGRVAISAWAGASLGFALLTVVLVIVARHTYMPAGRSRSLGSGGIVLLLCGVLFTVAGLVIAEGHPQGLIKAKEVDAAPIDSAQAMTQGIDRAVGSCSSGWQEAGVDRFVGVSHFRYCASNKVAYMVFNNDSAASLAKGPIRSQAANLLDRYGGGEALSASDMRLLSGKRWVVIGNADQMSRLQADWGGQMQSLESER